MPEKLIVGPFNKGLKTDVIPPIIDNDSFPVLQNAYQWRGRVKRKRGTTLLGQLQRYFNSLSTAYSPTTDILFDGSGNSNLFSAFTVFSNQPNASLIPGTVSITDTTSSVVTTDPAMDGTLSPAGTINYATGAINIPASAGDQATVIFQYYPQLPVMGIEEMQLNANSNVGSIDFDTIYSYIISTSYPFPIHDVSFYKNPPTGMYTNYVQKGTSTPITWNGQDYQQFWTTNYQGALWATNGINVPFSPTNIGMQYAFISAVSITNGGPPAIVVITTSVLTPLVVGDFVFINEIKGMAGINFQSGYVTAINTGASTITVTFPNATVSGARSSGGIVQFLTNRMDKTKDCIRWFDGDPTNGVVPPTFIPGNGWVNYCPPLSQGAYSISDLPQDTYYLVGCIAMLPFKDRLLFFGPVIQTSKVGSQVYLQDTIIYTQNGTPYYTSSYTNSPIATNDTPTSIGNQFNPILVPINQTATSPAVFTDQIGFGGWISAGVNDRIISVGKNEDALIVGFTKFQTRVLSTGSDVGAAFEFFIINSELGTGSTFSSIIMDQGVLSRGSRGFVLTAQTSSQRFDLDVIDQAFQMNLSNNGNERFTAIRDFQNEWLFFTYNSNQSTWRFPNETLFYNYRDQSFALFYESYTTYGPFTEFTGKTWADLTTFTWSQWNSPWSQGDNTLLQPIVLGGNQQGFILIRESNNTGEDNSLIINNIVANIVTSNNHNLNNGDFIVIYDVLGTIGPAVNGLIFQVSQATNTTFQISPNPGAGTYLGNGYITRMYVPNIQTKQFPAAWEMGRKTRIGTQQYLLTKTPDGQITVQIYLSQDTSTPYNNPPIPPALQPLNSSLIYNQIVFTCQESTNLGLTPLNTNLLMLSQPGATAGSDAPNSQARIWHRMNTSLIGDTIQLGFTLNQAQMLDPNLKLQFREIELHGFILDISPSQMLS